MGEHTLPPTAGDADAFRPGRAPNLVRALTQTRSLVTSSCPDLVDTKNEVNMGHNTQKESEGWPRI